MIYYYKIVSLENGAFMGVITSNDFRKYINGRAFIAESPKVANCFIHNNKHYRAIWMTEAKNVANQHEVVNLFSISENEYNDFLNPKTDKENLNENN